MKYTELFINERDTLVVRKELACLIGLNEAIVLNQVYYWLKKNEENEKNFIDSRYWVFNTYKEWKEDNFPFWSIETVKRTFSKLEKDGILISANYNKMSIDRTKWYSINYEKLQEILKKQRLGQNDTMDRSKCHNPKCQNDTTNNHRITNTTKKNKNYSATPSHEYDFSLDIIKKAKETIKDSYLVDAVEYYLGKYRLEICRNHPDISYASLSNFAQVIYEQFDGDIDCLLDGGLTDMINRHFETNYGKPIDYKFQHFATPGIILCQARNCGLIDGLVER